MVGASFFKLPRGIREQPDLRALALLGHGPLPVLGARSVDLALFGLDGDRKGEDLGAGDFSPGRYNGRGLRHSLDSDDFALDVF